MMHTEQDKKKKFSFFPDNSPCNANQTAGFGLTLTHTHKNNSQLHSSASTQGN